MTIIKGTTPTIQYAFETVQVTDITRAILTVKRGSDILIERDLSSAEIGTKTLSWKLTQEESLSVDGDATVMLNWKLSDGTRGATNKAVLVFTANDKDEVI